MDEPVQDAAREPLFPMIDLFPEELAPETDAAGTPDVSHYRRAFRAIAWYRRVVETAAADEEKVLEKIAQETQNVKAFYENKRRQAEERIALWMNQLDVMMKLEQVEKKATPYGTSFYRTAKEKVWNADDAALLAFAKSTGESSLVRTKEYPEKKMIEEYIGSTGKGTELLTVTPVVKVAVRLRDEEAA